MDVLKAWRVKSVYDPDPDTEIGSESSPIDTFYILVRKEDGEVGRSVLFQREGGTISVCLTRSELWASHLDQKTTIPKELYDKACLVIAASEDLNHLPPKIKSAIPEHVSRTPVMA